MVINGKEGITMLCIKETIKLDYSKLSVPDEGHETELYVYIPNTAPTVSCYTPKRPTVIVLPGGGYSGTSEREADPIALKYLARGFNAAILYYSCAPSVYPVALLEALSAVKYIRDNADEFFADPDKIYLCGFSAGGHLAASCGTHWHRRESKDYFGDTDRVKPNGLVLGYPVISGGESAHLGSFKNLLAERYGDEKWMDYLSLEKQVDQNTPEAFIWGTYGDNAVPFENSMLFADAMGKAGVPFELHIFRDGPHGISTADKVTTPMEYPLRTRAWLDMSADWISEKDNGVEYRIYKD